MNVAEEEEEEESEPPPTIDEAAAAFVGTEALSSSANVDEEHDGDELETVIYGGDTEFSPRYSPRPDVQGQAFQY